MDKQSKSLKGMASTLKDTFGQGLASVVEQSMPLLKDGLEEVTSASERMFGWFNNNRDSIGKVLRVTGTTLKTFGGIASTVFGSFTGGAKEGMGSFERFANYIDTHQAAITSVLVIGSKFALEFGGALAKLAAVGLRGFAALSDGFDAFIDGWIGHAGLIVKGAAAAFGWIPGIGDNIKGAEARFGEFAASTIATSGRTGRGLRGMADVIDNKVTPAIDKAKGSLDKFGNTEVMKAKQRDQAAKAAVAIEAIGTKADGSQLKLKTFADRTKLTGGEQTELSRRIMQAKWALFEQVEAARRAAGGQKELTKTWQEGKRKLYDEFVQMGLSKKEAQRLADKYAGIKPKVETKVTQPGMQKAKDDTDKLAKLIRDIPTSKKVTISFSAKTFVGADGVKYRVNTSAPSSVGRSGPAIQFGGTPLSLDEHGTPHTSHGGPGPQGGGPDPKHSRIQVNTGRVPRSLLNQPGEIRDMISGYEQGIGKALGAGMAAYVGSSGSGSPGGVVGTRKVGGGWGPVENAMRAFGARSFNTYPGHHPSMAMARDVYPHNWAAANAARALSSVWYVIYRMKIASKNHGNTWREYRPTNFRGDWRHERHIHVARRYDTGGMLRSGEIGGNQSGAPERVLSPNQTRSFENLVRVLDRQGGVTQVHYNITAPNYVGSRDELVRTLIELDRRGRLTVLKR